MCFVSSSDFYYGCVNAINCIRQNMWKDLLIARGVADANMYLCAKDLRPSKNTFSLFDRMI